MDAIVNKVAESGIITLDLSAYLPDEKQMSFFDLKPFLFREMILKEKDYRAALQTLDWALYKEKYVAIGCSADAIIPVWAYMLAASYLQPQAIAVLFGSVEELKKKILLERIDKLNTADYADKRVVIKGCGDIPVL